MATRYVVGLSMLGAIATAQSTTASCATTTVATAEPTDTALAFRQYSYCGGSLYADAYINNTDYDKIVDLYYQDGSGTTQTLAFGYVSSLPNSNNQIWSGTVSATVTELVSIVYNATDVNQNSEETLDITVTATGPASPTSSCVTHTFQSTVPTATALAFQSYSYCAGVLYTSAYVNDTDYDKIVNIYYSNKKGVVTPLTVISLGYVTTLSNSINPHMQIWAATTSDVYYDGITELVNITYAATDVGLFYSEQLNIPVVASGGKPSTTTSPSPYASPTGFSSDIATFVAPVANSEAGIAKARMFNNIEVTGAAPGTIVAAQSYANPDYGYNWVRDSSLTMDVVATLYAASKSEAQHEIYTALFFNYSLARATEQNDPNLQTGLGEPKFNLDNSIFTGPWGRPQNDGPATAAITLMEFASSYLNAGGSKAVIMENIYNSTMNPAQAPVMRDLLFVATNWSSPSFDLWEEEEGDHFYTRNVQYRALTMGASFATRMGDAATSATLTAAAKALKPTLSQFWDPIRGLLLYEYGGVLHNKYSFKDTAVILGIIHGYNDVYNFNTDEVLASAYQISTSFLQYGIANNKTDGKGRTLGIPIGRYPEDTYNGVDTSSLGNPWYLCTTAFAEFFYRAAIAFQSAGKIKVTKVSLPFWNYYSPQSKAVAGTTYKAGTAGYNSMLQSLQGWGDAYMRTVKRYTPANGHLTEEYNRDTGVPQGAIDLTWSYGAFLTASFARAQAAGQPSYVQTLADIAVTPNKTGVYRGKH